MQQLIIIIIVHDYSTCTDKYEHMCKIIVTQELIDFILFQIYFPVDTEAHEKKEKYLTNIKCWTVGTKRHSEGTSSNKST